MPCRHLECFFLGEAWAKIEKPYGDIKAYYTHLFTNGSSVLNLGNQIDEDVFFNEVYFNWQQKFFKEKLRVHLATYSYVDSTGRGTFSLTEGYLEYRFLDSLYSIVGQRREVWGNGVTWNPANIVGTEVFYDADLQRNRPIEAQKGRLMAKIGYLFPDGYGSFEVYALPLLVNRQGDYEGDFNELDLAAKLNLILANDFTKSIGFAMFARHMSKIFNLVNFRKIFLDI